MLVKGDSKWNKVVDVVVVGYGLAGAAAAITASELGSEVLVLEKQPEGNHHSNSSLAGPAVIGSSDVRKTVQYFEGLNRTNGDSLWTEHETVQALVEYVADNPEWLRRMGGSLTFAGVVAEHPDIPGAESMERWRFAGGGFRLMHLLYERMSEKRIEIRYNTVANRLLTNLNGEVVGVRVQTEGGEQVDIGALRGVILACGGFEFNERMKLNYLKVYPAYFTGTEANTGDGIRMALDVGADLWHMNCCSARAVLKFPEFAWAFPVEYGAKGWTHRLVAHFPEEKPEPAGYLVVDRYGKRYTNENIKSHCYYYELGLFDTQRLEYPRIPNYWIFDQKRMDAGPLVATLGGAAGPHQLYRWSPDNGQELEKGWIVTGKTVKEVARKLEIPADSLNKTVAAYNRYCERGNDPEFKRHPLTLTPLDKPPFYACRLWPGGPNTQGGPRRNARSQIVNTDGDPIPRLYSAGELGSIFGMLYPVGGSNLGECIASGRIAGENAAREQPFSQSQRKVRA